MCHRSQYHHWCCILWYSTSFEQRLQRARTCLNFENDRVTMCKKKIPLRYLSSGHYHIPIIKPLLEKSKFKHILFIKEISSNNKSEKIKIVTKLHRQFSHPSSKKLCDLVKNAGIRDLEFIKILQVLPSSCEVWICYSKTEPRPIVGFTLGSYFNENCYGYQRNQWQQSISPDWPCY